MARELVDTQELRSYCAPSMIFDKKHSIPQMLKEIIHYHVKFSPLLDASATPNSGFGGVIWDMALEGYRLSMLMGIRRLIDEDSQSNSIVDLLNVIQNNKNLLCSDGQIHLSFGLESLSYEKFSSCKVIVNKTVAHSNKKHFNHLSKMEELTYGDIHSILLTLYYAHNYIRYKIIGELDNLELHPLTCDQYNELDKLVSYQIREDVFVRHERILNDFIHISRSWRS